MRVQFALALACVAVATSASAQGLGQRFREVGDWDIFRSTDAMTDEPSCLATYDDKPYLQLTDNSFAVSYRGRGGIQGYLYRFDDEPASSMQLPSDIEERVSAIFLEGQTFQRILSSRRLRIQGLTLVSGSVVEDIDLTNVPEVMSVLTSSDCQGT